jgi:hypothetical protein
METIAGQSQRNENKIIIQKFNAWLVTLKLHIGNSNNRETGSCFSE